MAKASISIGIDDATGQPAGAPQGPYITDQDDGSRPHKRKAPHAAPSRKRQNPERDSDLASRRKGPAQP